MTVIFMQPHLKWVRKTQVRKCGKKPLKIYRRTPPYIHICGAAAPPLVKSQVRKSHLNGVGS
jgi:predicted transcriptional regulator